jgi:hypothetical protein
LTLRGLKPNSYQFSSVGSLRAAKRTPASQTRRKKHKDGLPPAQPKHKVAADEHDAISNSPSPAERQKQIPISIWFRFNPAAGWQ